MLQNYLHDVFIIFVTADIGAILVQEFFLVKPSFLFLGRVAVLFTDAAYCYRPSSVVCQSVCWSVVVVSHAKITEPVEMPFGLWDRMGPRKHALHRVNIGATWRIRTNRPPSMCGGDAALLLNYVDHLLFLCI